MWFSINTPRNKYVDRHKQRQLSSKLLHSSSAQLSSSLLPWIDRTILSQPCENVENGSQSGFKGSNTGGLRSMSTRAARKTTIHKLIEEEGTVLLPGVHDALAACVLQKVGFRAGFVSGFGVSASHLGKPDFGLLTTAEMTEVARRVCSASPKIAYIVDADTGGGGPLNVQRVVKDLIKAGASGIFLEDQLWPKKCGHMAGKQVVPAEEHAAKIAAARDAIGDADLFLVARTDARSVNGLEDAIERANLYYEAGADGLFVESPFNDEELKKIGKEVKGFKIANMIEGGKTPLHTPAEFREMGFSLVKHPLTSVFTTARALLDIMNILKNKGSTREDLDKLATFPQFSELMDLQSWYELESRLNSFTPETKEKVANM